MDTRRIPIRERRARQDDEDRKRADLDTQIRIADAANASGTRAIEANELLEKSRFWSMVGATTTLIATVAVIVTVGLAFNANRTANRANVLAIQSNERITDSNDIARTAVERDLRPWLNVTLDFGTEQPFTQDVNDGDPNWLIEVEQTIDNFGRSPASKVALGMRLVPGGDIEELVNGVCSAADGYARSVDYSSDDPSAHGLETISPVFPGQPRVSTNALSIHNEEKPPAGRMNLMVVGCLRYESLVGDGIIGYTPFAYHLVHVGDCNSIPNELYAWQTDEVARSFNFPTMQGEGNWEAWDDYAPDTDVVCLAEIPGLTLELR